VLVLGALHKHRLVHTNMDGGKMLVLLKRGKIVKVLLGDFSAAVVQHTTGDVDIPWPYPIRECSLHS
jgi:hypothetical protein